MAAEQFTTQDQSITAVQYLSADTASHTDLIALVGQSRLAWQSNGVLRVRTNGGVWLLATNSDWVALDETSEPHVFTQSDMDVFFTQVTS